MVVVFVCVLKYAVVGIVFGQKVGLDQNSHTFSRPFLAPF